MMKIKIIITCLVLLMALFQGPIMYYYTGGFGVFMMYPYMFLGFGASVFLLMQLKDRKTSTPFIKIGCFAGIAMGVASLFSEGLIEKLDWSLRRDTRDTIVEKVKRGELDDGQLYGRYFPPISNTNNSIVVEKNTDKTVSVTFLINSGFLDHYSGFLYTNDPDKKKSVEEWITSGYRRGFAKLDTNWYRVNY